jgi:hypothetical protein
MEKYLTLTLIFINSDQNCTSRKTNSNHRVSSVCVQRTWNKMNNIWFPFLPPSHCFLFIYIFKIIFGQS